MNYQGVIIDLQELWTFLVEAKKQTYANENVEKVAALRPGSNDFHYEKDGWVYHDTYFGGQKFLGAEVVYRDGGRPKWGMNYYGFILNDDLTEAVLDNALRPALMQVGEDKDILPVRGPKKFIKGEWQYTFKVEGDLTNFTGLEEISKNGETVYRLHCHGGLIQ
jgi:hypothetical protein